jgi:hypothetical protein
MSKPIDDYTGKRMTLDNGTVEHCDSCTDEITGDYIRVADVYPDGTQVVTSGDIIDFIYCLECGTDEKAKGGDDVSCAKTPIVCPECEHEIIDTDVLKCPTCSGSDYLEAI